MGNRDAAPLSQPEKQATKSLPIIPTETETETATDELEPFQFSEQMESEQIKNGEHEESFKRHVVKENDEIVTDESEHIKDGKHVDDDSLMDELIEKIQNTMIPFDKMSKKLDELMAMVEKHAHSVREHTDRKEPVADRAVKRFRPLLQNDHLSTMFDAVERFTHQSLQRVQASRSLLDKNIDAEDEK